jgi:hypothetical protein
LEGSSGVYKTRGQKLLVSLTQGAAISHLAETSEPILDLPLRVVWSSDPQVLFSTDAVSGPGEEAWGVISSQD